MASRSSALTETRSCRTALANSSREREVRLPRRRSERRERTSGVAYEAAEAAERGGQVIATEAGSAAKA